LSRECSTRCTGGTPFQHHCPENYRELFMGLDSSVSIATRYGLNGPRIEFRCGTRYSIFSRPALGPTQPPVQWVPGISWGKSGRDVALTTHPIKRRG
jgi:hypothetical protein